MLIISNNHLITPEGVFAKSERKIRADYKRLILTAIMIAITCISFAEPVRNFTLLDINNRPVSLYDYVGDNIIIISFWTGRCAPCLTLMTELEIIHKQYDDVEVIGVNIDYPRMADRAKSYIRSQKFTFNALFDNNMQVARQFQVTSTNHTFILGFEGEIIHKQVGYNRGDVKTMLEIIERYKKK